jgi:Protein of unknown function (DUF3040)
MPLSDREQQILSDIEARLRQDDPKLARTVGTTTISSQSRRQVKLALIGLVLGFLLLFGIAASIWFGIIGSALMLVSAVHGLNMLKRLGADSTSRLGGQLRGGFNRYLDDRRGRDDGTRT